MTRKQFTVTLNQAVVLRASTWNGAIHRIESLVRVMARDERQHYALTASESERSLTGRDHIKGVRVWTGDNGTVLTFSIVQVE